LNAKWMPALSVAAGVVWTSACLISTACAAPGPLSRGDVDRILAEAHSAIETGDLERAAALVEQAESAHPSYSLFHMGPTPGSVRRELDDARRAGRGIAAVKQVRPAVTTPLREPAPMAEPGDPFAQRLMAVPAAPLAQPIPPVTRDEMMPPVVPALHSQPVGVPNNTAELAAANLSPPTQSRYAESQTSWPAYTPAAEESPQPDAAPAFPVETTPAAAGATNNDQKSRAVKLMQEARQALAAGDLQQAEEAARLASATGVPESAFLPHEDRPSLLAWDIQRARTNGKTPLPAVASPSAPEDRYATQARMSPELNSAPAYQTTSLPATASDLRFAQLPEPMELPSDSVERAQQLPSPTQSSSTTTRQSYTPVSTSDPAVSNDTLPVNQQPSPMAAQSTAETDDAGQLLRAGEAALERQDRQTAAKLFGQAYVLRDELNPTEQVRLQGHLGQLAEATRIAAPIPSARSNSSNLIDSAVADQQTQARQMSAQVGKKQSEARRLRETKPQEALKLLQETREQVANSQLSEEYRTQLLRRIDITLDETEKYIKDHHAEIELDQQNQAVLEQVDRSREVRIKVQQKVAELVDEFNKLADEQRYAEMEVVARRLIELAPEEPVAQQVWQNAKFIRRNMMNLQLADERESSNWNALNDVETSAIQKVGDGHELVYDEKSWNGFVKNRKSGEREARRTERELEIERRLKTPVLLRYEDTPLSEVIDGLSNLAGVNIHLDPRGLSQEGVESSTPVTINLSKEISLKSALNLILEPLHLSYVIKDEVLKITSEQLRDGETYVHTYNVADLVIPIPNFVPNNNIGLQGLINDAHATIGYGGGGIGVPGPTVLVNDRGPNGTNGPNRDVLAQQFGGGAMGGGSSGSVPIGSGPGGMGGGANADFDSLIDLIVSTVASETWAENGGGEAEIRPFPTNLSLVISQTQAVHEQIADLLEQLRRLQDLQVTIEVRFIRLNDSFFERIGIDFDANIGPAASANTINADGTVNQNAPSAIVGVQESANTTALPVFTTDLDVPFRQNGFSLATAPFGSPERVANFGFAILSEIEAYFLIEAAQGDRRTNLLNAPKVTLFNGQQAFVADAVSRPFVIGVIPVVGEFAAAQQPVIVVLNEGTLMTIQAVVSNDRRYVRLTVVPFFTQVGDVQEFTFEGSSSTTSSSSTTDDDQNGTNNSQSDSNSSNATGVTVQLPSFQFIAVVTTVSVPDGGTVLLGGIKRLNEGRNEIGVPLLSKVPYVNRLFRNIGIGRTTDSLMMMVTPRIIIQEEEEERMGLTSADQGTY
jgi:general secretion pathway protein D